MFAKPPAMTAHPAPNAIPATKNAKDFAMIFGVASVFQSKIRLKPIEALKNAKLPEKRAKAKAPAPRANPP